MKNFLQDLRIGLRTITRGSKNDTILFFCILPIIIFTAITIPFADYSIFDIYLPLISIVATILIIHSCSAWTSRNYSKYSPDTRALVYCIPAPLGAIFTMACLAYSQEPRDVATFVRSMWYIQCIVTTIYAIVYVIASANFNDKRWLAGNNGKIGTANLISATRIAIAILIPHILLTEWLGAYSKIIASIILTLAVATDKLDGTIARKTNSVTRAGMVLDPIGDKALFYPVATAFVIIFYCNTEQADFKAIRYMAIAASAVIIVARDAIVLAWYLIAGRKSHEDIGATKADKARMVTLCVWLLSTMYGYAFTDSAFGKIMQQISIFSLFVCAIFSIYSVISDFHVLGLKDKF